MSFWFRQKDAEGRTHYFSVSAPLLVCIAIVGMLLALITTVIAWLRGFFL